MKQLFYLFISLPLLTNGQSFTLNDTIYAPNSILITDKIWFETSGGEPIHPKSKLYLDTLASFLLKNKELIIEVGIHCDSRGNPETMLRWTYLKATKIINYLITRGVDANRLIAKGYANEKQIVSDAEINSLKNEYEIEEAHQMNNRTELKIIRTDYNE